ncbi:kinesin-like protein [Coemansia sp. RSA 355]|nr:kinesin-like protein [Coemansia sp. RSA 355]
MFRMRSAPASNRGVPGNGNASNLSGITVGPGDKSPDIASTGAFPPDAKQSNGSTIQDTNAPVYTHEEMLELFRPQEVTDDFVVNDCVFTEESLLPICMTELTAKEQELLSSSVNSITSRRYNGGQHMPHVHTRTNGPQRGNGPPTNIRARPRDGEYAAGGRLANGLDGDRDSASLWADQSIVRDSVGSFGADGVFRMSGGDGEALQGASTYSSRTASPAVNTARAAATKSSPVSRSATAGDSWAWNDLAAATAPAVSQQRALAERAERIKWVYRDPQGNTQGPFSTANMQEWCSAGYFPADLQVCHEGAAGFEPLSTMIARAGQPQGVFLYVAASFLAQTMQSPSGLGTPATPAALSRVGSSAHLMQSGIDTLASSAGLAQTPLDHYAHGSLDQFTQVGSGALRSGTGSASPANGMLGVRGVSSVEASETLPAVETGLSQAAQLSALLKEQMQAVAAIGERQHMVLALQEQLKQSLAKLMRELTQESNAIHYKAQMEQTAVQPELLYALQQHAQAAEDRLRLEYAQLAQMHASHIAQLETSVDPVIKDIMLRSGAGFALEFIEQRLQELSMQVDGAQVASHPVSNEAALQQADVSGVASNAVPSDANSNEVVDTVVVAQVPEVEEPAVAQEVNEATSVLEPASDADVAAVTANVDQLAIKEEKTSRKSSGSKKAQKSGSAKKQAQSDNAVKPDSTVKSDSIDKSDDIIKPEEVAVSPKASPAPWSTPVGAKAKQPKKSLLQIQLEEEAAMKRRHLAEEEQRQATGILNRAGTSYADRVGSGSTTRSLAAIMEEQYKQSTLGASASDVSSVSAGSKTTSQRTPQTTSGTAWANTTATSPVGSRPVSGKQTKAPKSDIMLPSMEFLQWCQARLGSLRGIDASKFIEMLLTFPLEAPESTLEIISEQIYAFSTTLNGRAFAEDFAKRRRKDHNMIKGGALKSAPINWPQQLRAHKSTVSSGSGSGYAAAVGVRPVGSSNGDASFKVVSKKGRK